MTLPNSDFVLEPKSVVSFVFPPAEFKNDIKNDILALVKKIKANIFSQGYKFSFVKKKIFFVLF